MSASVYANPYIYKPPPPRIEYPSLFHGFRDITCRYVLDSKILALAVVVLGLATVILLAVCLLPFWFKLVLDPTQGTFGSEPVKRGVTINTGLFYMRTDYFDNTVFLDKYTNANAVPPVVQAAQAFFILGFCVLAGCTGASIILAMRRFSSVTALMILAGATTLSGVCQVFVIIFCAALVMESSCDPYDSGDGCHYKDNLEWNLVPIYSQFRRMEPNLTPYVEADWAFYIAIIGVLVNIGAAVMVWIEALMTSSSLRKVRYSQLKEFRDPYENEVDPFTGKKFQFQPPTRPGPHMYGMQPVILSDHPYEGMVIQGPPSDAYVPPASFAPQPRPPSPGFGRRYGPPSSTSSVSGPPVAREIDL